MPIIYPTIDQAIDVHRKTVEVSGGGVLGHLDMGRLESVLDHIQNDDYYPTFEEKLSHLFHSACKSHCFQDGNKRIAISLGAQFLIVNGYIFVAGKFIREMENIATKQNHLYVQMFIYKCPCLRVIVRAFLLLGHLVGKW